MSDQEEAVWFYADQQALLERIPIGPVSIRDLDVLYRTSCINSATFVWKEGMAEWIQLHKVDELKDTIVEDQDEIKIIQELFEKHQQEEVQSKLKKNGKYQEKLDKKHVQNGLSLVKEAEYNAQMNSKETEGNKSQVVGNHNNNNNNKQLKEQEIESQNGDFDEDDEEDEQQYLKLLQENPEEAIQQMVQNMMNSSFYFTEEDKKWNACQKNDETSETVWIKLDEEPKEEMQRMREELLKKLREKFSAENISDEDTLKQSLKEHIIKHENLKDNSTLTKNEEETFKGMSADQIRKIKKSKKKAKRAAEKKKEKWYQAKINTYIYVSGLPHSITIEKIDEFFSRAGVIRKDHFTGEKKIKLYKDDEGKLKGDCVISYQMIESVDIAVSMLDEREIDPGYKVHIEPANFNQHGDAYKKREIDTQVIAEKNIDKVQQLRFKAEQKNQLGWEDEDQIDVGLKIVILKNVFDLQDSQENENFFEELREEIAAEIENSVGQIQRIKIFEENPEGILEIKFKDSQDAQYCIELMNGRFFDTKQLECFFWDGQTDYRKVPETIIHEEDQERLEEFGEWIQSKTDA